MLDGLYCEFLKLKRTGYYIFIPMVSLLCLFFFTMNKKLVSSLNWYGYFSNFEYLAFTIFFAVIIPLIISFVFIQEFKEKIASITFSYPSGRFGVFINKFLMCTLIVAIIYITGYILVVLSGFLLLRTPLEVGVILNHSKVFLISLVFQIALMPFAILVALIGKSTIVSSIYSIAILILNSNYIFGVKYKEWVFSILPAAPVAKLGSPICSIPIPIRDVVSGFDIFLGSIVFIIGFIACVIFYKKANIY
ncbi:ABC transporter permease [Clostridium sediminicola]|uniref:ABC transporter permease n=1 Tax=Clostridium sediminicola TaxID=3114879 RepID=UPI0031F23264